MGIKALHNSAFSTWSARVALQSVQKSHPGVGDSALKKGWITPVTCQFDVLLSPILVLVLCSMFFDPFDPLITSLILPTNSLALFLVQKLRERQDAQEAEFVEFVEAAQMAESKGEISAIGTLMHMRPTLRICGVCGGC